MSKQAAPAATNPRAVLALEALVRMLLIIVVLKWGWPTLYSDVSNYFARAGDTGWGHLPYRDYLWEYPPFAALPLVFIPLTGHSRDGFYVLFMITMVAIEYASLEAIRRARPLHRGTITLFWTIGVLPLAAIAYFRLDFIVMGFAVMAMLAMVAGKRYVAPVVLGFGTKLWPLVFLAPMLLQRRLREIVMVLAGCAVVIVGWYMFSPDGLHEFLDFRRGSGFQVESIPGSLLLLDGREPELLFGAMVVSDSGWEWVQTLMSALLLGIPAVAFVAAWRRRDHVDLVAFTGFLVVVALLAQRLLSPQFLVWLAPFVVWLWPTRRRLGIVFAVSTWITVLLIQFYSHFLRGNDFLDVLCVVRNGLLLWVGIELLVVALSTSRDEADAR